MNGKSASTECLVGLAICLSRIPHRRGVSPLSLIASTHQWQCCQHNETIGLPGIWQARLSSQKLGYSASWSLHTWTSTPTSCTQCSEDCFCCCRHPVYLPLQVSAHTLCMHSNRVGSNTNPQSPAEHCITSDQIVQCVWRNKGKV